MTCCALRLTRRSMQAIIQLLILLSHLQGSPAPKVIYIPSHLLTVITWVLLSESTCPFQAPHGKNVEINRRVYIQTILIPVRRPCLAADRLPRLTSLPTCLPALLAWASFSRRYNYPLSVGQSIISTKSEFHPFFNTQQSLLCKPPWNSLFLPFFTPWFVRLYTRCSSTKQTNGHQQPTSFWVKKTPSIRQKKKMNPNSTHPFIYPESKPYTLPASISRIPSPGRIPFLPFSRTFRSRFHNSQTHPGTHPHRSDTKTGPPDRSPSPKTCKRSLPSFARA